MSKRLVLPVLAVLAALIAGCTAPSLEGTAWRLEDLAGTPALPNVEATLEFMGDGKIAGKGSCNRFFGTVTVTGATLVFGPIGATKMACLDAGVSDQETRYFAALEGAERYELRDGRLDVFSKGSRGSAALRQRARIRSCSLSEPQQRA
jgi:heat shock protein HslJ